MKVFSENIASAENIILRLVKCSKENMNDPTSLVPNSELADWYQYTTDLIEAKCGKSSDAFLGWQKLVSSRDKMVADSIRDTIQKGEANSLPGYINHLRRSIMYLSKLDSLNLTGGEDSIGVIDFYKGLINKMPKSLLYITLAIVGIVLVSFAIFQALPDSSKEEIINSFKKKSDTVSATKSMDSLSQIE